MVEHGKDSEGDVECYLDEIDTEPLRNQLQQEPAAELMQRVIEQADSIRVIRAALDSSDQQPNQWSKTYRRRFSSRPQAPCEKPLNPLWGQPAQKTKCLGQPEMPRRVSRSPVPTQSIRNSRCRQGQSQIERRIVTLKTRSRQATSQVVPTTASAVEETGRRTRTKKPLSNTSYSLTSGRSWRKIVSSALSLKRTVIYSAKTQIYQFFTNIIIKLSTIFWPKLSLASMTRCKTR